MSQGPGPKPEPQIDPPPDHGPGGPADEVGTDTQHPPVEVPDQPMSAQVEEEEVPDEIEEADDTDTDADEEAAANQGDPDPEDSEAAQPGDEPTG